MNAEEIVKALRWLAKVRTYCDANIVNCSECEFHGFCTDPDSEESIGQQAEWTKQAADLIESLTAQLKEARQREKAAVEFIKYLDCNYSGYMTENERFAKWRGSRKERENERLRADKWMV